jgi:hypothetical protein
MPVVIQAQISGGDSDTNLNNFQESVVVRILVNQGQQNILVIGKVVIANFDGDSQNANVRLTSQDGRIEIDRADVRIPGGGSQVVVVDGWIRPPDLLPNDIVDLRCSTFAGAAKKARLNVFGADVLMGG